MSEGLEACLNCATPLDGIWCSRCGQANRHERMRPDDLAADAFEQIVGIDTRIGRTFIDFTLRPGRAALAYVQGHRSRYLNPLKYLLFSVALYFLALKALGLEISDLSLQPERPPGKDPVLDEVVGAFLDILNKGLRVILFTAPPIFAWVSNAFLGRRHFRLGKDGGLFAWVKDLISAPTTFNFAEGCSLWMHAFSHAIVIFTLPAILLAGLAGVKSALLWGGIPTIAYYIWAARQFYGRGWIYTGLIVVVSYVCFQIVLVSTLVASVAVAFAMSR